MNPPEPITAGPVVLAQTRQQWYAAADGRRFVVTTGTLTFTDPAAVQALHAAHEAGTLTIDLLCPRPSPPAALSLRSLDVWEDDDGRTIHFRAEEGDRPDFARGAAPMRADRRS